MSLSQIDNAKYHHARFHKEWREKSQARFQLDYLPEICPELNPIERMWNLTRRQATHNRFFPYLEIVLMALDDLLETWRMGIRVLSKL
jgi:transposase